MYCSKFYLFLNFVITFVLLELNKCQSNLQSNNGKKLVNVSVESSLNFCTEASDCLHIRALDHFLFKKGELYYYHKCLDKVNFN